MKGRQPAAVIKIPFLKASQRVCTTSSSLLLPAGNPRHFRKPSSAHPCNGQNQPP
jgi:hypothetical protein